MDFLQGLLNNYQVLLYVGAALAFLQGLNKALGMLKDKTESKLDDKAFSLLSKVIGAIQWALQLVTANSEPKK